MNSSELRDIRQKNVHAWCIRSFGAEHSLNIEQRAIRFMEEAIELAQVCNCNKEMLHKLIDYVYNRPVGRINKELGGVGLTILALSEAARLSADECEINELQRVLSYPPEHFSKRNQEKNEAGFNVNVSRKVLK